MVARAGAGPEPINNKKLTADNLAAAIQFCQKPEVQAAAKVMAESIAKERGAENGAQSFQDFLPVTRMRCEVDPRRSAVFMTKKKKLRLSAFATAVLCLEVSALSMTKLFTAYLPSCTLTDFVSREN